MQISLLFITAPYVVIQDNARALRHRLVICLLWMIPACSAGIVNENELCCWNVGSQYNALNKNRPEDTFYEKEFLK